MGALSNMGDSVPAVGNDIELASDSNLDLLPSDTGYSMIVAINGQK